MKARLLLFLLFVSATAFAQRNQTIRGTVVDAETGQPLVGATVFVETHEMIGASADLDGRYKLERVPVGRLEVKCSYVGYEPFSSDLVTLTSGKELTPEHFDDGKRAHDRRSNGCGYTRRAGT